MLKILFAEETVESVEEEDRLKECGESSKYIRRMAGVSIKTRSIITSLYLNSHTAIEIAKRLKLNVKPFLFSKM